MSNDLIFEMDRRVSSAFIDSTGKMGISQSVLMVQDNLTECFGMLKADNFVYREKFNAFWVFTKTRLHFEKRPFWQESIKTSTFPVNNMGFRANINTLISDKDGEKLITANQECCCLDFEKHRPLKISNLDFPKENFPAPVFTDDFEKFGADFTEENFVYSQTILSQMIDMSHHLNNIEYVKLGTNAFSDDFINTHEVKDLEVHYLSESKEGQNLRIFKKELDSKFFIKIMEQTRPVFEMMISFY